MNSSPSYNCQASVIVDSATCRNVTRIAPSTGPQKIPTPPMNVISSTAPDASDEMLADVMISSFSACSPPATPANSPASANTRKRIRAGS